MHHNTILALVSLALLGHICLAAPPASVLQPDVPYTDSNPNKQLWHPDSNVDPEPIRGDLGATVMGPDNKPLDLQNADSLAPPTTDHGSVPNFKWPFSLSHNKLEDGGWARQQNGETWSLK